MDMDSSEQEQRGKDGKMAAGAAQETLVAMLREKQRVMLAE